MATLKLSRAQLASFLKNHEQIKQFEQLFSTVSDLNGAVIDELLIQIDNANNTSNRIDASLTSKINDVVVNDATIESKIDYLFEKLIQLQKDNEIDINPIPIDNSNIKVIDYIDFNYSAPHVDRPGRMSWNPIDQTIDVCLANGVTLQEGQELHARVINLTGSTILNGTVVGISGGSSSALLVQPYLADGSMQTLMILGVMTHDIASGATGYATVWGNVRQLNTSAFANGTILYASPSVAGGYTNVKPTAPNKVIPIAYVTSSNASTGAIFVKPAIDQDKYYAEILKTSSQTLASANTAYPITWSSISTNNGFTIGSPTSRIVATNAGYYQTSATIQLTNTNSTSKTVWLWWRKNGTDIANKSTLFTTNILNGGFTTIARIDSISLAVGDYLELMIAADANTVALNTVAATAFAPAAAAAILDIVMVQQ